jgi:hypothetical protein
VRAFDFSSWSSVLTTLIGLALFALIGIGMRLLIMLTVQQRRERRNRQINERLKTLITAYKTLGGSFTGNLAVDPTHLRDIRRSQGIVASVNLEDTAGAPEDANGVEQGQAYLNERSDRSRRIRDAVEAALSDIILLGTEQQVHLAAQAARDLVAGRQIHIDELVVSLCDYIRKALDLDPVPADLLIPRQGPLRPVSSGSRGGRNGERAGSGRGRVSGAGTAGAGGTAAELGLGLATGKDDDDHR